MRAVWSFWSKPLRAGRGWRWRQPVHHLLAWGLSVRLAREHYPETVLITDSPGKALLVSKLGLAFTHVSTELDRLREEHPGWWSLGKLVAYSVQDKPFVHLDTDVFLWRSLPGRITSAPVLAQHPEHHHVADKWCGPRTVEGAFAQAGLTLPDEWKWSRSQPVRRFREANCGILGGTNFAFINYYARLALDLVLSPQNSCAWASIPDKDKLNTTIEQFLLVACAEFHRSNPVSPHRGVHIKYLFPSTAEAFDAVQASRLGYTHLLGEAKQDVQISRRLEQRLRGEDAAFYHLCRRVAGSAGGGMP
jgi:hypothetical protein